MRCINMIIVDQISLYGGSTPWRLRSQKMTGKNEIFIGDNYKMGMNLANKAFAMEDYWRWKTKW